MNSWFEHNLRILKQYSNYDGLIKLLANLNEDTKQALCSLEDAKLGADESIKQCLELHSDETIRSVVITGFEYGFLTEKFIQCMPMENTAILVLETDIHQIREAMRSRDLSHIFSCGQVVIYTESANIFIKQLSAFIAQNFYFTSHRVLFLENPALRLFNEEYVNYMRLSFSEARHRFRLALGNSPEDTLVGNLHSSYNITHLIKSYPFDRLRDRFSKIPAICVAAGPSLEKNMDLLKGLQSHALIFACDTIMEKLQKHGIEAHFMASLERGQEVYKYFYKNKTYSDKTILLGLSLLYPSIYEEYRGDKVIVARKGLSFENWLGKVIPTLTPVHAGHSVAHLNYTIAKELGCDPIILIGQDLAYGADGHTHETYDQIDSFAATKGIVESNDKNKLSIKGYYGGTVKTQSVWELFRKWFEDRCTESEGILINATEGGAYIEGALHMPLAEVIEKYCQADIDLSPLEDIRSYRLNNNDYSDQSNHVSHAYKEQLEQNLAISKELEKLIMKIKRISKRSDWNKNKAKVVSKFQIYYQQFLSVVSKEENILNAIQFTLSNMVAKINRRGAIETFEEVEAICLDLENIVKMAIHYIGKMAEIYGIGIKVLDDYSESLQISENVEMI
jgi:hypothetical protein